MLKFIVLMIFTICLNSLAMAQQEWKIALDGSFSTGMCVAQNGTIYLTNSFNQLYSISPEGRINWMVDKAGTHPSLGFDGTIYVGNESTVKAIKPDGQIKWTFSQSRQALMFFGPEVGPDGNIYGVATEGIGPFSLTSEGKLRWSGEEKYNRQNTADAKLNFGYNGKKLQMYYYANNSFKTIDTETGSAIAGIKGGLAPRTAPNGDIHVGTKSYAPNGVLNWNANIPASFATLLEVDSHGTSYYSEFSTELHTANINGNYESSYKLLPNFFLTAVKVDPLATIVMISGSNGQSTFIEALQYGSLNSLWTFNFGSVKLWPIVGAIGAFNHDGSKVYAISSSPEFNTKFYLHSFRVK